MKTEEIILAINKTIEKYKVFIEIAKTEENWVSIIRPRFLRFDTCAFCEIFYHKSKFVLNVPLIIIILLQDV